MATDNVIGKTCGCYIISGISDNKCNDNHKKYKAECIYCGHRIERRLSEIKKSPQKCYHIKPGSEIKRRHEKRVWMHSKVRGIFSAMVSRCYNPNAADYKFYGEKGVRICKLWSENPILFEKWAHENGYEDGLSIDRINSDRDYSPDNCRWVTSSYNSKWKSTTNAIEVNGTIDSGRGWSKRLGLGINHINKHIAKHGEAVTKKYIESLM